jgi:3-methyladenine DNA glycosylase AlkD
LHGRLNQILEIQRGTETIIQDRTIYEDAHIFAPNLHAMGLMTNRDFQNYTSLFELMESLVKAPDLLIYLRSSIPNLVGQIHKRGRDYENSISIEYLSRLNERYEAWIQTYNKGKLLIIDVDNIDFVNNWDLVDATAYKILGEFFLLSDKQTKILEDLANANNIWHKRIAIVATLAFIRQNQFENTVKIANILLNQELHDLLQKAIGWMLREIGKKNKGFLLDFLRLNHSKMPTITFAYSTEKLTHIEKNEIRSNV